MSFFPKDMLQSDQVKILPKTVKINNIRISYYVKFKKKMYGNQSQIQTSLSQGGRGGRGGFSSLDLPAFLPSAPLAPPLDLPLVTCS